MDMEYSKFRMAEKMSIPLEGKLMILNKLKWGDRLLLLYGDGVKTHPVFQQFINNGLANGDLCLYAFDVNANKLSWEAGGGERKEPNLHLIPLEAGKQNFLKKFNVKLTQMYSKIKTGKYNGLRIIIDFGNLANSLNPKDTIACEKEILRKTKESLRLVSKSWSKLQFKHYKSALRQDFPIISLTAYNIASTDNQSMKSLIGMHNRVLISTEKQSIALLPNFITTQDLGVEGSLDSISEEAVKDFVKNNLESIILLLLYKEGMCGYDVIKAISRHYHVFLTQATVYSNLYSLEKAGLLKSKIMPDNKTKVFVLNDVNSSGGDVTQNNIVKNKLKDFSNVLKHTFSLLKSNGSF